MKKLIVVLLMLSGLAFAQTVVVEAGADGRASTSQGCTAAKDGTCVLMKHLPYIYNGTSVDQSRSESSANQTGGPITGVNLVTTPAVIAVNSQPAVSNQASASVAAGAAGVKHVIDKVCFSAGSTTAPVLTQLSINIRDGATGAGTVKASFVVIIPAATGQNVAPFCTPPLNIAGTAATAATAEFSALLTNLFEQVTLFYHDIN